MGANRRTISNHSAEYRLITNRFHARISFTSRSHLFHLSLTSCSPLARVLFDSQSPLTHLCSHPCNSLSFTPPLPSPQPLRLLMSRRSGRLAAKASNPPQEPIPPARTRKQPVRQSTGGRGPLRLADPGSQDLMLPSTVKRQRMDAGLGDKGMDESTDDHHGSITDPARVKRPTTNLLSPSLSTAWRVNGKHKMCLIFDAISPACRFKRGMVYDDEVNFPKDTFDGDITETDGPGPGWMPVDPTLVW